MGCGFSNEKSQRNLSNKDIINILDDTQRYSYFSPTMLLKCLIQNIRMKYYYISILLRFLSLLHYSKLSKDKKSYFSPTMGTSQSKRSNKISKFRSSSVGAVGEFAEEDESNTNSNNSGKLSSMKGIPYFYWK